MHSRWPGCSRSLPHSWPRPARPWPGTPGSTTCASRPAGCSWPLWPLLATVLLLRARCAQACGSMPAQRSSASVLKVCQRAVSLRVLVPKAHWTLQ